MDPNVLHDPASLPEVKELDAATKSLVIDARTITIATPEAYEFAGTKLGEVKSRRKALDELRRSMTRPLDEAKKAIMAFFRGPEERLDQAESTIKRSMIAYSTEQERLRRAEQARLEEQARKERERLEARAEKALAAGKEEKAAELVERAATVVAPIAQTAAPKVANVSFREVWKFEVVDEEKLDRAYLIADEAAIRKVVQALKGDAARVLGPGVRVWSEKQIAAGAA